jgi:hypothetical protein
MPHLSCVQGCQDCALECRGGGGGEGQEGAFGVSREVRGRAPVLDRLENVLENIVAWLTGKELEVLLHWKGVPVSKMGNVANRRVLYQQFADGGEEEEDDASIPAPWTDADKTGLVALRNVPIKMADTSYGRFLATQKRDAKRAFQHMSPAEREAFLRRLMEIDADNAKDGQSPPSNPTPV